jgi:hypothetical protein
MGFNRQPLPAATFYFANLHWQFLSFCIKFIVMKSALIKNGASDPFAMQLRPNRTSSIINHLIGSIRTLKFLMILCFWGTLLKCDFLSTTSTRFLTHKVNQPVVRYRDERLFGKWINLATFLNDTSNSTTYLFNFSDNQTFYRAAYHHTWINDSFADKYQLSTYGSWDTSTDSVLSMTFVVPEGHGHAAYQITDYLCYHFQTDDTLSLFCSDGHYYHWIGSEKFIRFKDFRLKGITYF